MEPLRRTRRRRTRCSCRIPLTLPTSSLSQRKGRGGYSQTKQRACPIANRLALLPSPSEDETVEGVCAGIRRTRCCWRRGLVPVRPIFGYEIPSADDLASLPLRVHPRGSCALQASVDRRARVHAARISAILGGAALHWDWLQEAQLRNVILLPGMTDFCIIFGCKTDTTLSGKAAVLSS